MDDLTNQWARLSLKAKENNTIDLPPTVENNSRVLVAKLFTKRRVNLEALTRTLRSMWRSVMNFEVRDLGSNTVLIIFDNDTNPQKIIAQGPWTFDKYLIGLYNPVGEESVTAEAIGRTLGTIEQVDVPTTRECRGRYL
ncbi:hypothetical protein CFP56_008578 [Quercus suber]|uniref:DUF4283 domain-containing protein n=1 Tax=Quercus suber TaxID=58331 RepID=A0AAW0IQF5_QUESU